MIPYLEILDKYSLKKIDLVEPKECWLEISFQDVGEFEVLCKATQKNRELLKKGYYIKIPNKRFVWVITSVRYTFTANEGRMILAKGYEAKWLLSKRCILTPRELQGSITSAVYGLVNTNMGTGADDARKIQGFTVGTDEVLINISGTQAPRGNLLEFVNNLLKAYNCGSQVTFEEGELIFRIINGEVRTGSVRFSQSLDNLLTSEYLTDDADIATNALVVSTVDDVDYTNEADGGETGIDRAEIIVSSNLSTKYEDADGNEQETTPTSELYKGWQTEEAKNELAKHTTTEEISGEIDIANSNYKFDEDFFIGDMVQVQDEYFSTNTRISKYTFKQDTTGYGEEAEYWA